MKCERCKYLYTPTYENETESYCTLFSDDSDDLTDDGCRFNARTLDAKARKKREEINSIDGYQFKKPEHRDKFRVGCEKDGVLVGVAQVGRPVARGMQDGKTLEVVRLCTDGTKDVCSFLYSRCARIAKEMGYKKIITYILDTEDGTSLKASGWKHEADTRGGSWDTPSRRRNTTAPTCKKQRWCKILE